MSSNIAFTLNDGVVSEKITIDRTAQYVHLRNGAGYSVSIPRELLPAVVVTLQRELEVK